MNKTQLRQLYLSKRKNLTPTQVDKYSQTISNRFFSNFNLSKITNLHIFLPILKHNEINTWFIIKELRQNYPHISLITSKSDFQFHTMESYIFEDDTQIIETSLGIPEPYNAVKFDNIIDMILIPLLCFDQSGFRVGYGKGFYDRFLLNCNQNIIKIGLSLFEPIDKIDDVDKFDLKMDFCVTTCQVLKT
ncbi:5-formyltetrahydrofolate cyclo-ligase [Candidatus Marithrix sp. Canyon 246]|uniref:5-formyltetrahydrofolate cyclo-ligase n=1 Tax=Candidatus Marithrix sp. Canyon 246 TaxID=1827136 RepID=UPI000849F45F|nr:5-formyltetrahydrofolate cyclo-ligase [Candidatus Marithrix sp. Canyon 246]